MQHVRKMYEENKFFAKPHTAIGIQLDDDEIQVGPDQTTWTEVMEGQWVLQPQKPVVSLL